MKKKCELDGSWKKRLMQSTNAKKGMHCQFLKKKTVPALPNWYN
jgi:hypothetical protein